jgi:hypothetical protein
MDKEEAIKYSKAGATAAFISGGLTTAIVLFAILTNAKGTLEFFNDPAMFIDIFFIFGCAIGMLRYSRTAAITIFVYSILDKLFIGLETREMPSIGIALVFLFYFGRAIQGTFAYHKIQKEQDPNYRSAPKWIYYVGIPSGLLALMIVGSGILRVSGVLPAVEVTSGSNMRHKDRSLLIEKGIIQPEEDIKYFYSNGIFSILEEGNVLTDQRVIRYVKDETSGLQIYELFFGDIADIKLIEQGSSMFDSIYEVGSIRKDASIRLSLSVLDSGDTTFVEALRNKINVDPSNAITLNDLKYMRHVRVNAFVKEIRSNLMNAADAQASYFAKNKSYKSCAACTAKNLPGYEDNPNVTLVAEVGKTNFVLVATHLGCGDDLWTYQNSTGTIAEASNGCNNAPSY